MENGQNFRSLGVCTGSRGCFISDAVDGGQAESCKRSIRRRGGTLVSALPGAAGCYAREGGRHRSAGAAAGGAGRAFINTLEYVMEA